MDISNEELFANALSDEPIEVKEEVSPEPQPEPEKPADDRPRDEHGRFAPKPEDTEKKPEDQAKPETKEEAQVPSWRLRELREAREAAERRAEELERQLMSFRQQQKPEPAPKPDLFEKPDDFVRANVQEALSPIEQKFTSFIETVSRRDAIREHGEDKVSEAYQALDAAAKKGDPGALAAVQAVKQSMDPFGEIVGWYRQHEAALNPDAYFQRMLESKLADEKFKAELAAKLQPQASADAKPKPVFNVPPSLNRAASAASSFEEGGDLSNESLFRTALS